MDSVLMNHDQEGKIPDFRVKEMLLNRSLILDNNPFRTGKYH